MPSSALLTAPVRPLILRLALPSVIAMVASSLGALLDALLLCRSGAQAAAAVSLPLLTAIQTLGFTLGMGSGSFVSRCLGTGDHQAARTSASTAFFCALAVSLLLCAAGFVFSNPLCVLLGASGSILPQASAYARYVLVSGPLLCMGLVLSSLLRAQGKTAPNMFSFGLGAAAGAALQLTLIPRMGVHGAGIAMLVREGVTLALLGAAMLRGKSSFCPSAKSISLQLSVFRDIMRSGAPTLLRQGLMSVSAAMLTKTSAQFGEGVLSGMGLGARVLTLISAAVIGFGQGFQPVCGAAFGAKQPARIREAYRFCMRTVVYALLTIGAVLFFSAERLLSPFSADALALETAKNTLRVQSVTLFAQGAVIMMNMLTQAMGLTLRAGIVAASRQGFVFIPLLMLLVRMLGLPGLILCQGVSDLLSLILGLLVTRGVIRDCACARGGCSDAQKGSQ